jgi:hypothetical protein
LRIETTSLLIEVDLLIDLSVARPLWPGSFFVDLPVLKLQSDQNASESKQAALSKCVNGSVTVGF